MIQVNRIYLIFNRLVTKKFLVDTSVIFLIIPADIAQKKCQPIRTDILTVFIKNSLCLPDAQLVFFFVY